MKARLHGADAGRGGGGSRNGPSRRHALPLAPKLTSMVRVTEYGNGTSYCHCAAVLGEDVARELRAVLTVVRAAARLRGPEGLTDPPLLALDRALAQLARAGTGAP